jgi:uncharacterized protein
MTLSHMWHERTPLVTAAMVLGLAFILGVGVASYTAYSIKLTGEVVEVTGSAKVAVTADFARWNIMLEARTGLNNQQVGYDRLERATEQIVAYLAEAGFTEVEIPTPSIMSTYVYPQYGEPIQTGYSVTRSLVVRSSDIDALAALTSTIDPLLGEGYTVTTGSLELTYQKLPETRVALLTDAIADAKARAEAIAKETDREVGALRSATGGVVQVLPLGGVEVSDYGAYDTQSKEKEVMVTVRATFSLK